MPAPLDADLRLRVVQTYEGGDATIEEVAERFRVACEFEFDLDPRPSTSSSEFEFEFEFEWFEFDLEFEFEFDLGRSPAQLLRGAQ